MRHFALEQAQRGVSVIYHFSELSHAQALVHLQRERNIPELTTMMPAERELRIDLQQAASNGLKLKLDPDSTWLSTTSDFTSVYGEYSPGKSYVMDRFYRKMRQQTGILMQNGRPIGKQFSFDAENRKPWRGEPAVPEVLQFPPDEITREVIELVCSVYGDHFGNIENFNLPVTQRDCDRMWRHSLEHLLPYFGPFEDAMRDDAPRLFHSRVSALVN